MKNKDLQHKDFGRCVVEFRMKLYSVLPLHKGAGIKTLQFHVHTHTHTHKRGIIWLCVWCDKAENGKYVFVFRWCVSYILLD